MNQRGRKSGTNLTVILPQFKRLDPPDDLPSEQREIWLRVTASRPAEWFGGEHLDMLRSYTRHVVYADTIARTLDTVRAEWLADPERLADYKDLYKLHELQSRAAAQWATRMRLTQQSVDKKIAKGKADNFTPGARPWQKAAS